MARTIIDITHDLSAAASVDQIRASSTDVEGTWQRLLAFLRGIMGGAYSGGVLTLRTGGVAATATLTFTSTGPANDEAFTVCGTTFTAKTSGATGNQWNRSDTVATSAANLAAAINASATAKVTGVVTASAALGVVTFTANIPGKVGNGLEIAVGTLANTALSAGGFSGGDETLTSSLRVG